MRLHRFGAAVGDFVAHVDDVAAAMEGEHLGDFDAVLRRRDEAQDDFVLAVGEHQRFRRQGVERLVRWQVGADQAALCGVQVRLAVVEQHERLLGFALLVFLEFETNDGATFGGDFGADQVGFDHRAWRTGQRAVAAGNGAGSAGGEAAAGLRQAGVMGGRAGDAFAGDAAGRWRGRTVLFHPALPQHDEREREDEKKDEATLFHRNQ